MFGRPAQSIADQGRFDQGLQLLRPENLRAFAAGPARAARVAGNSHGRNLKTLGHVVEIVPGQNRLKNTPPTKNDCNRTLKLFVYPQMGFMALILTAYGEFH
jgi:hypothetical protein